MIHSRLCDRAQDGLLELGLPLLCAVVLGACSTRTGGVGSSHPSDVGGSANSTATPTSTAPPTSASAAGSDGAASQALVDGAVLTPERLAAEFCKKLPACANLVCPGDRVPQQRAVCKPNDVPVCECIVMQTGR